MTFWPEKLTPDRYPGTIRREITVESQATDDGHLAFTAVLRDRWLGDGGAEEQIHGYEVRLVARPPDLEIISIEARPRWLPLPDCPSAALTVQRLVGLRLTDRFRSKATEVLGSVEGCTHLLTLVLSIWSHQVVTRYMLTRTETAEGTPEPDEIAGTCSGWREGGVGVTLLRQGKPVPKSRDYSRDFPPAGESNSGDAVAGD